MLLVCYGLINEIQKKNTTHRLILEDRGTDFSDSKSPHKKSTIGVHTDFFGCSKDKQ